MFKVRLEVSGDAGSVVATTVWRTTVVDINVEARSELEYTRLILVTILDSVWVGVVESDGLVATVIMNVGVAVGELVESKELTTSAVVIIACVVREDDAVLNGNVVGVAVETIVVTADVESREVVVERAEELATSTVDIIACVVKEDDAVLDGNVVGVAVETIVVTADVESREVVVERAEELATSTVDIIACVVKEDDAVLDGNVVGVAVETIVVTADVKGSELMIVLAIVVDGVAKVTDVVVEVVVIVVVIDEGGQLDMTHVQAKFEGEQLAHFAA
jgi:hypothetical protein